MMRLLLCVFESAADVSQVRLPDANFHMTADIESVSETDLQSVCRSFVHVFHYEESERHAKA